MKRLILLAAAWTVILPTTLLASDNAPIEEHHLIKVPDLPLTGTAFVSWFFLRNGFVWQNGNLTNMNTLPWPTWDREQIPAFLVPEPKQKTTLLILDSEKKEIERLEIKEAFSPANFKTKNGLQPAFYRIVLELNDGRLEFISPAYDWISPKKIARCEVELGDSDTKLASNVKLKTCVDTLLAYAGDVSPSRAQYYIHLDWPAVKGKENIMAAKAMDRDLRSVARKSKTIFLSQRIKGRIFRAEVGVTQNEKLPSIGFPVDRFADSQNSVLSPDTKTVVSELGQFTLDDGSRIRVMAKYNDGQTERSLTSPNLGGHRINLQIVGKDPKEDVTDGVTLVETRERELRTGIQGFLRPWQILAFGNLNSLTSNRGETNTLLGLPGVDLKYNLRKWDLQPYLRLEKQLIHLGSPLSISEFRAGFSQKIKWVPTAFYSLGMNRYALSGQNPGTSRLGSFDAVVVGGGASQRIEDWGLRQSVNLLLGNSQSLEVRADAGRYLKLGLGDLVYVGTYLGFSHYQAFVLNKLNNRELFSEQRLQLGLAIGWIGPDSF